MSIALAAANVLHLCCFQCSVHSERTQFLVSTAGSQRVGCMTGQYEGLLADLNHFMKRFGPKVFKCQWCQAGDISAVILTNQAVQA